MKKTLLKLYVVLAALAVLPLTSMLAGGNIKLLPYILTMLYIYVSARLANNEVTKIIRQQRRNRVKTQ